MPSLPRGTQRSNLPDQKTTQARLDPQVASSTARAVGDLADKVNAASETFLKLDIANQVSEAKIKTADAIAQFNDEIMDNPDAWEKEGLVADRLEQIGAEAGSGLSYAAAQDTFKS